MNAPAADRRNEGQGRREPTLVEAAELATEIWFEASGHLVDPHRVEILKKAKKSKVFRLPATRDGQPGVIAKIRRASEVQAEVDFHNHVAHTMPIRVPELQLVVDIGRDAWMFYEDAGRNTYEADSVAHQRALTSWLATVHRSSSRSGAGRRLPNRDAAHYLRHLESARSALTNAIDNRELLDAAQPSLRALSELLDELEQNWHSLVEWCERAPRTLVHGDLVPKNILVYSDGRVARPLVLDWEMAGWGIPAPDLAAGVVGARIRLDQYMFEASDLLDGWSQSELRTYALIGTVFRYLAATDWAARGLMYPPAKKSIRYLTSYSKSLADTVRRCGVPGVAWSPA